MRRVGLVALALAIGGVLGVGIAAAGPLIVVAGLAGLALGAAMLVNTRIGLLAFVGAATLLPFGVLPVPLGPVKLTFVDVTLSVLLLVWLGRILVQPEEKLRTSGLEPLVLIFIGLAVVSFLIGTSYSTSAEAARLFLKFVNGVLLFFTTINCVRTRRQVELVVGALVLGAAASASIGIILYYLPADLAVRLLSALAPLNYPAGAGVLRYIASTTTLRAISTSIDPNVFGAMLMLGGTLGLSQMLSPKPVVARRWLLVLAAPILALLLSYSRGSWIAMLVAALAMATLRYRRLWLIAVLAVAVVGLGLVPGLDQYLGHLQSGIEFQDQAAAMRLGEYKDALNLIAQYPFFGVGFGSAPDVNQYVGVSSIYLLVAEQMGLIGLGAFLLTVGAVLWRAFAALRRGGDPATQGLLLGVAAALVGAMTAGAFDHHFVNLQFPHLIALFWLLMGLTTVSVKLSGPAESEPASA